MRERAFIAPWYATDVYTNRDLAATIDSAPSCLPWSPASLVEAGGRLWQTGSGTGSQIQTGGQADRPV